jgi:lysophospholipase L1-like esterase
MTTSPTPQLERIPRSKVQGPGSRFTLRILVLTVALAAALPSHSAPGEMRVTLLGDSLAFGAGDEEGKGIGGRLEPELRSRGVKSIVTSNLGVTGATTSDLSGELRKPAARKAITNADAIVISIGANDLRSTLLGEQPMRSPLVIADEVLQNIEAIVGEVRRVNPKSRILILGAYAPVAHERAASFLEPLVTMWDAALVSRFVDDPLVSVVRMSDIIDRPERLSKKDSFHPAGEAYQETARRIADVLIRPPDLP